MKKMSLTKDESGVALVTALLVLALASALMAGMFAGLLANQRSHATDRDQSVAYAAAHAGLEKLTASLAVLFGTTFNPTATQIATIASTPPTITGFTYAAPGGTAGTGYTITFTPDPGPGPNTGNPLAFPSLDITTGPFEGFKGLITPYTLTVTARSTSGNSEVRLRRELQTVAVPVFQFGIFGEKSLGFHAGPNFDFGGRVHTNQSLYLASGDSSTLTFRDKITAFVQVKRNTLSNGSAISLTNHEGHVSIPTVIGGAPATYRDLLDSESSGTTAVPWGGWKNLSEVTYHTNIRTEATGAKQLQLPLATQGATPIDLIKRPAVNSAENVANPAVFGQRYYAQASLRILLSDRDTDITNLPAIGAGAPLQFDGPGLAGYVVAAGRPAVAASPGPGEPYTAATGLSQTRLSGTPAAGASVLTIENNVATGGGAYAATVPAWVGGTLVLNAAWNPVGPAKIVVGPAAFPHNLRCTGMEPGALRGCNTSIAPTATTRHPAYAVGQSIQIAKADGTFFNVAVTAAAAANSETISVNLTAEQIASRYPYFRQYYVGRNPVFCTGFRREPAALDQVANSLTGCTYPAGATFLDDDPIYTGYTTTAGTPLLNGFIKIERQNAAGVWTDVTLEILNLGFADRNYGSLSVCDDPTPNAVIRLQRFRDNGLPAGTCVTGGADVRNYQASTAATDFIPLNLFDAREASNRQMGDNTTNPPWNAGMNAGGIMGYVALDVNNLRRWFAGEIGLTGNQAWNNNGYIVYFSDRRGDHDETQVGEPETGEYGNEDLLNPSLAVFATAMAGRGVLETGEDYNENNTQQTYGETPWVTAVPAGAIDIFDFDGDQRPWSAIPWNYSARGRVARPVLFRRALKLINGGLAGGVNNLPASGFTVVAENPVYIQGNYNAESGSVIAEPNRAAAVIADSITLLSNAFNDAVTFRSPNDQSNRNASNTGYRFAMVTGKAIPFPKPGGWGVAELGSDGGVHNFMKMLEDWGGTTLRYRGSMVSLYYSRQAVGIYRADGNIYSPPTRGYNFDTDFLSPPLLPPGTPMFRDINTLKFRQILRPNQ